MTQDQYGQAPGTVVRGEVVTDEVPDEQAAPMTQFQKVASAASDEAGTSDPDGPDEARTDEARTDEIGAVRSPDAGDDWDDEHDREPTLAAPDQTDTATSPPEATAPAAAAPEVAAPEVPAPEVPAPEVPAPAEVAGKHAAAPASAGLRPGEAEAGLGDFSELTYGSLLPDASEFQERWQQVQFRFVDDPNGSVTEAADVIAQVTARLEAAIAERQRAIAERQRSLRGRWGEGANADTETLRATLLMYRAFLDQLTGSRTG